MPRLRCPIYAAGSLRAPLTETARAFEAAQLFAWANMENPQSLSAASGWGETRAVTRNALCALALPRLALTPETLVASGQADVFITYCTNAAIAVAEQPEQPGLQLVDVPAAAQAFADYLFSTPGQAAFGSAL